MVFYVPDLIIIYIVVNIIDGSYKIKDINNCRTSRKVYPLILYPWLFITKGFS